MTIHTLLIANRGEIARRVIRTARQLGLSTVAVHSDPDRSAPHVGEADSAVALGGQTAAESYLNVAAILDAARLAGADAVHPGYGFLSENAGFAEAAAAAGLVFVGPPPAAIRAMGDKAAAKRLMAAAGVPTVPGHDGADQTDAVLARAAEAIGYPLLIKAVAGGGGRGMRRVDRAADFAAALESARREAQGAFGDGRVLLEKLIEDGRHIEIQVFADRHGHVVHLGERDCSAQRRHQKVIEEQPSPFVDEDLRQAMGEAAVAAARAVGYEGAGTVEFIVGADRSFYFLEMNTRLQVEHPVTEMVTGLDLVEWQIRVARGEPLPLAQDGVRWHGHAIEARLYAEDPAEGFRPQTGPVLRWRPQPRTGWRIDDGVAEGGEVTPFYDPMIAKLIVHAPTRAEAVDSLQAAIAAHPLFGLVTNRGFLAGLIGSQAFGAGAMTTNLIDRWAEAGALPGAAGVRSLDVAVAAAALATASGGGWFRSSGVAQCPLTLEVGGVRHAALCTFRRGALADVAVDGVDHDLTGAGWPDAARFRFTAGGVTRQVAALRHGRALWLDLDGRTLCFVEPDPLVRAPVEADPSRIVSPVAGLVRSVMFAAGDEVAAGETVAVVEAMKMETALVARLPGRLAALHVRAGDQVRAGDTVAEIGIGD